MAFGGGSRFGGPRKTFPITCSDCGQQGEVPFEPSEGKPVYCRDCYPKHRKY
ncbi:MAG: DNA-directed RNA polymerase [Candidatus Aenigmarchaeota archaeon]|nr:DNA-directed RNA polymerase [Candidatus Aenigmarchaeota archaeon]